MKYVGTDPRYEKFHIVEHKKRLYSVFKIHKQEEQMWDEPDDGYAVDMKWKVDAGLAGVECYVRNPELRKKLILAAWPMVDAS